MYDNVVNEFGVYECISVFDTAVAEDVLGIEHSEFEHEEALGMEVVIVHEFIKHVIEVVIELIRCFK